ncbi:MAG: glycoside hydrolase family 43 protein [Anaerolineales bacterium]|nr:glycoside hydrolase family 43 protein [Anaerolineales bacterium]
MKQYKNWLVCVFLLLSACAPAVTATDTPKPTDIPPTPTEEVMDIFKKPLVTNMYTADPSAHVFDGKIYIYPSHDLDHNKPETDQGDQFDMEDYHVFSMENMNSLPVDHGEVLNVKNVPWATMQMWAPDATYKNGKYYLYFPARDKDHIFRIGVATSDSPAGPFTAEPNYIQGSFSIDPAVFIDDDGQAYMYFGGLMGGQLEKWRTNEFNPEGTGPRGSDVAIGPRVVKLSADMLNFDGAPQEITLLDQYNAAVLAGEDDKRFFEAAWMHKYNGIYYLSYSTGTTHYLAYATGDNPMGPFKFRGYILTPVLGWTTHHSIVEFQGKWYLFYHDAELSGGTTHKRNIKVAELTYNEDGTIQTLDP